MNNFEEVKTGDKVQCKGTTIIINEILDQDFYRNNWSIEFKDLNGAYYFWKQQFDGGKLIRQ